MFDHVKAINAIESGFVVPVYLRPLAGGFYGPRWIGLRRNDASQVSWMSALLRARLILLFLDAVAYDALRIVTQFLEESE